MDKYIIILLILSTVLQPFHHVRSDPLNYYYCISVAERSQTTFYPAHKMKSSSHTLNNGKTLDHNILCVVYNII